MLRRKFLMAVAAAAVAGLLGPTSARAGFTFTLNWTVYQGTDNTGPVVGTGTITDNGTGDADSTAGTMNFLIKAGDTTIQSTKASSGDSESNAPGNTVGSINVNGLFVGGADTTTTPRYVVLDFSDQFTSPSGDPLFLYSTADTTAVTGVTGASAEAHGVVDVTSPAGTVTGSSVLLPDAASTTHVTGISTIFSSSSSYTLHHIISVTLSPTGRANFSSGSDVVAPAPATAILALAGAPIFGAFGWMRRRKAVVA